MTHFEYIFNLRLKCMPIKILDKILNYKSRKYMFISFWNMC